MVTETVYQLRKRWENKIKTENSIIWFAILDFFPIQICEYFNTQVIIN